MVCYHAQQTVEKVLKSVLAEKEVEIPRIHNLLDLNNSARRLGYATDLTDEEAIFLNTIYRWRYPPDLGLLPLGEPTEMDAQRALNIARAIVYWSHNLK
jgi:HEPN domain-containing protein